MILPNNKDGVFLIHAQNDGKNKWKIYPTSTTEGKTGWVFNIELDGCKSRRKPLSLGSYFSCCTMPNPVDERQSESTSSGTSPPLPNWKPHGSSCSNLELSGYLLQQILHSSQSKTKVLALNWDTPGTLRLTVDPVHLKADWKSLQSTKFAVFFPEAIRHSWLTITVRTATHIWDEEQPHVLSFDFGRLVSVIPKKSYSTIKEKLVERNNRDIFDCDFVTHDKLPYIELKNKQSNHVLKLTSKEYVYEIPKKE